MMTEASLWAVCMGYIVLGKQWVSGLMRACLGTGLGACRMLLRYGWCCQGLVSPLSTVGGQCWAPQPPSALGCEGDLHLDLQKPPGSGQASAATEG